MSYDFSLLVPYKHDNYGPREDNWQYCWRWWQNFGASVDLEICIGQDDSADFNRSKARNNAFQKSTKDLIVIADADTVVDSIVLGKGMQAVVEDKAPWYIPYKWYYNLSAEYSEIIKDDESLRKPDPKEKDFSYEHKILSWAGILIMKREAYEAIGGYDERFERWGHEDLAFRVKLDAEWGKHQRPDEGGAYHFWHPINKGETFNSPSEKRNRALFNKEYAIKYEWKDERYRQA